MECPFIRTVQNVGPAADVGSTNEVKLKMAIYIYISGWWAMTLMVWIDV